MRFSHVSLFLAVAALAAAPRAQTVYGVNGPAGLVVEMSGPPNGPCGYPDGPVASAFNYPQAAVCAGNPNPGVFNPGGAAGPFAGDIAINRDNDIVYVTDGQAIASYDAQTGVLIRNFGAAFLGLAPPLTGLGVDDNGWLWITDPGFYAACEPNGTCAPIPRVPATPAPAGLGLLTDIDRDPQTGQLWVCDNMGQVAHFNIGAFVPNNIMNVVGAGGPCGGLNPLLTGLCIDSTTFPFTRNFFVTDGLRVVRMQEVAGGGIAPPILTFAFQDSCWPAPGGQALQGLGFSAHGITYGAGGGVIQLETQGNSTLPSATFTLRAQGGPAGTAFVLYDFSAACPALAALGQPLLLPLGVGWGVVGPLPYAGGAAGLTLPLALPPAPALPYGLTTFLQVYVKGGGAAGTWRSSNGVAFTTSRL